jgi:hypothetical protein
LPPLLKVGSALATGWSSECWDCVALPDAATLSRLLQEADARRVDNVRGLLRELIFQRLRSLGLARLTLDFDGSV